MTDKINLCACIGPIRGEEFCPCKMKSMGLRADEDYKISGEEAKRLRKALAEIFEWNILEN